MYRCPARGDNGCIAVRPCHSYRIVDHVATKGDPSPLGCPGRDYLEQDIEWAGGHIWDGKPEGNGRDADRAAGVADLGAWVAILHRWCRWG